MNILLNLNDINYDYIFYSEPTKNSIIENGMFTRIIYSNTIMSLNGFFITFSSLDTLNREKMSQKKIIELLIELEKILLFKADISNKKCQYKIKDYFKFLNLKLGEELNLNKYILKISGIWETESEYGITFKLIDMK